MEFLNGKSLLITGGTGSLGTAVLQQALRSNVRQLRVFSRDEKKQDDLRHWLLRQMPDKVHVVQFFLGDVREPASLKDALRGVEYVFHAAALKQVPSCEFSPMEAVKTNILGTDNVLTAAVDAGVSGVVCLSTDKAVYPTSAMGATKELMELVALAKARRVASEGTKICCTRLGNVLCSRGSVVPLWIQQIRNGEPITVTDPDMTRFLMTPEQVAAMVGRTFAEGQNGDIWVPNAPGATLLTLAQAVTELFAPGHEIRIIGPRHGEKQHETLLSCEERSRAVSCGNCWRVPLDGRGLFYAADRANEEDCSAKEFNSNDALMSVEEVKALLKTVPLISNCSNA